jgi:hypothetical protein
MLSLKLLSCVSLLAAAAAANSAPPIANQVAPSDSGPVTLSVGGKADVADKKICRQLPSSSSRLPNRVCLTAKEWDQVERDSQ